MQKIIVEKYAPPKPPEEKVKIITPLNGKELVAYVTEANTICLLQRISKNFVDVNRFGFFNMAYSDSSSPTFAGSTWYDAVKKAGAARTLYAFETYDELLDWIADHREQRKADKTFGKIGTKISKTAEASMWITGEELKLLDEIPLEEMDLTGSNEINHTHKNMTTIFKKVNELVKCLNIGYYRNKTRIFAMAYGATPPNEAHFETEEKKAEKLRGILPIAAPFWRAADGPSKIAIRRRLLNVALTALLNALQEEEHKDAWAIEHVSDLTKHLKNPGIDTILVTDMDFTRK